MGKIKHIESFKTISQCVEYLVSIGCEWSHENELELSKKKAFQYKYTLVFYDKFNLIAS